MLKHLVVMFLVVAGNFDVLEHIQANVAGKKKASSAVFVSVMTTVAMWRVLM